MGKKINSLLTNQSLVETVSRNGKKIVNSKYSISAFNNEILKILDQKSV